MTMRLRYILGSGAPIPRGRGGRHRIVLTTHRAVVIATVMDVEYAHLPSQRNSHVRLWITDDWSRSPIGSDNILVLQFTAPTGRLLCCRARRDIRGVGPT